MVDINLIDKHSERIKIDYSEDDKFMRDLQQWPLGRSEWLNLNEIKQAIEDYRRLSKFKQMHYNGWVYVAYPCTNFRIK